MTDYSIVHLATHAFFATTGQATDSFILFGNGTPETLQEVQSWDLKHVNLVVLSACQTGLGGVLGDGREILGFGYVIQKQGARSVLSSLWEVDDGGTQVLMDTFYAALRTGKLSTTGALQQAQIALIHSTSKNDAGGQRAGLVISPKAREALSKQVSDNLSHPYYWAPFILIGNGL